MDTSDKLLPTALNTPTADLENQLKLERVITFRIRGFLYLAPMIPDNILINYLPF